MVVILHCNQYCDTNLLDEKNHCNCVLIWRIAARTYLPFMAANAAHLSANSEDNDMFSVDIFDGDIVHRQRPSGYRAECWQWLNDDLAVALQSNNASKIAVLRHLLESTGCGPANNGLSIWGAITHGWVDRRMFCHISCDLQVAIRQHHASFNGLMVKNSQRWGQQCFAMMLCSVYPVLAIAHVSGTHDQ